MTRPLAAMAACAALACAGPLIAASPFKDKNLEAAVQAALRLPKADFKDDDLAKLSILHVPGKKIADLTGLEKCKGLLEIKLDKNQVSDLKPLKELTLLQSLHLPDNKISDLSPLAGLVKLQYLDVENNQVADLKPLAKLTAMQSLLLTGNKIGDLSPIEGMTKLASLHAGSNQLKDVKALTKVTRIGTLDLSNNQISDLSPIASQRETRLLMLNKNKISDLGPLVKWAKADAEKEKLFAPYLELYLEGNPIEGGAKNKQVAELKALGVRVKDLK